MNDSTPATLWAVADLHAAVRANRERIAAIEPSSPRDWLIVAGDVAESTSRVLETLSDLHARFDTVVWVPGNHELFSRATDAHKGKDKYADLVAGCRSMGVFTPEDPFPVFDGVTVAGLFTLYDYSFRGPRLSVAQALEQARARDFALFDDVAIAPFVDVRAWCQERLAYSIRRLSTVTGPTILVNHWPLVREPTRLLRYPDLALWCGTKHTRGWAERYQAHAVVYGHLHMPGVTRVRGVDHIEVSLGYPREWGRRRTTHPWPYPVLVEGQGRTP